MMTSGSLDHVVAQKPTRTPSFEIEKDNSVVETSATRWLKTQDTD